MKKCPYCAEDIQDAAIVCRYCGRDLSAPTEPIRLAELTPLIELAAPVVESKPSKPAQKSIWQAARPAAIVITILYVINVFIRFQRFPSQGELVGDLTFGLLATFLAWWFICAVLVWLWRKFGAVGFIAFASLAVLGILAWNNSSSTFSPPPAPTATRLPTSTPRPRATATLSYAGALSELATQRAASDCTWWYDLTRSHVGKTMCIQGVVDSITGNTGTSNTRIYFRDLPAQFYFFDDNFYYPDLTVGHCVSSTGSISVNDSGVMFMRINHLQSC